MKKDVDVFGDMFSKLKLPAFKLPSLNLGKYFKFGDEIDPDEILNLRSNSILPDSRKNSALPKASSEKIPVGKCEVSLCIGVVGSMNSGKKEIIGKECPEDHIHFTEQNADTEDLEILTCKKIYSIAGRNISVQYWISPENEQSIPRAARYMSGLAATIFFFDVNNVQTYKALEVWFSEISRGLPKTTGSSFGFEKFLVGTGTDTPGLRVILTDEAQQFADEHDMAFYEMRYLELM